MSTADQLAFQKRDNMYALVRQTSDGARTEVILSETNIIALSRLVPAQLRAMLAEKTQDSSDAAAVFAIVARSAVAGTDALRSDILLTIDDAVGSDFDYVLTPAQARTLAAELTQSAETVERASKQSHNQ